MRNAQQQCMFESLEKQDLSQLLKSARRPADKLSIVFLVLTRWSDLFCSANAVSAENCIFFFTLLSFSALDRCDSNLWKSFTVPET